MTRLAASIATVRSIMAKEGRQRVEELAADAPACGCGECTACAAALELASEKARFKGWRHTDRPER